MRFILYFLVFIFCLISSVYLCIPRAKYFIHSLIVHEIPMDTSNLPPKNKALLKYAALKGPSISPTYQKAVCTEYLIQVLENVQHLSNDQKRKIRIITDGDIEHLLQENSSIPRGVYHALVSSNAGIPIDDIDQVKAGDLIQFWDNYFGTTYGHCGIIRAIDKDKGLISMYSSSPQTNGHGIQVYWFQKYMYFVRLK